MSVQRLGLVCVICLAAGYLLGLLTSSALPKSRELPSPTTVAPLGAAVEPSSPEHPLSGLAASHVTTHVEPAAEQDLGAHAEDRGAGDDTVEVISLAQLLEQVEAGEDHRDLNVAVGQLLADGRLLGQVLAELTTTSDAARLQVMAVLLARAHTLRTETVVLQLALTGDMARRMAALDILDAWDTPAALGVVQEIFANDQAPELLSRALYALPPGSGMNETQAAAVRSHLGRLAASGTDMEVRRRALLALGSWGGAEAERILVDALGARDAQERAAAAFALEQRRTRSPAAIAELTRLVANRDEDKTVRENAFQALARLGPLPAGAAAAYQDYLLEREGN